MRKLLQLSLLILPLLTLGLVGCGEDDGPGADIGAGGSAGTGATGGDAGSVGGTGGSGGDDKGDGGACENTRSTCDECVTPEENTYQACSPHTDNCVPFDNAGRIPGYPDFPKVP